MLAGNLWGGPILIKLEFVVFVYIPCIRKGWRELAMESLGKLVPKITMIQSSLKIMFCEGKKLNNFIRVNAWHTGVEALRHITYNKPKLKDFRRDTKLLFRGACVTVK